MMAALIIFLFRGRKRRFGKGNCWYVYGPTILAVIATLLVMADSTRHVLQDTNVWPSKLFAGMRQADIVLGWKQSDQDNCCVSPYYAPENGQLATGNLQIKDQSFAVEEFSATVCFRRDMYNTGHYDAIDNTYIIWAIGSHSYTMDSLKHSVDPLEKMDSNPSVSWQSDSKMSMILSDPSAINLVTLNWTKPTSDSLSICVTASGPTITSRTWVGLGFTKPQGIGSGQYVYDLSRDCNHDNNERMACLTPIGIIFTILCTYTGFVCLAVATLWHANIVDKLGKFREKWREIRAQQQ